MKLNHDCVRKLMLILEDNLEIGDIIDASTISIDDFSKSEILYSALKLHEANYISGKVINDLSDNNNILINGITWEGDSMIGARICDGDTVYIKQQPTVENGQIAAVLVDGAEKLLKRVYITEDSIVLQAENPAYPPRSFFKEDMNRVSIIGRAVGFYSNVK